VCFFLFYNVLCVSIMTRISLINRILFYKTFISISYRTRGRALEIKTIIDISLVFVINSNVDHLFHINGAVLSL